MKKITTLALVAMVALSASAAKKKAPAKDANKPEFTVIMRTLSQALRTRTVRVRAGITQHFLTSRPKS